ncbi:ParB/RepB/Spo0J family partition protein [Nocardiopsis metallicus]|uniref:ParB family chromosome partitioning protein n=1 Tax=Nocardiopsis metallicus TaxID=179819 RepID=A0A840WCJ4_9ACTN|nr:ParB N-terminal domain-containing protein [Nocardiopsis metallicus]MBB5494740.1 ParB family chromosome partitioning protein [Nocardiopsis metallicus]
MSTDDTTVLGGISALMSSPRLRQRRMDSIPLRGPSAPTTLVQGRQPGDTTTPTELSDLISSISTVGVLQPVLAEEIPAEEGPPRLQLVTGERRLRACRWGAANLSDNPHFDALPAIICPGPLSESERRTWQIVENLAREPLRPGEQAAALMWHRCAVLTAKLLHSGKPVPAEVDALQDPVQRWEALERIRGGDITAAAPWTEVLNRLGLQLSPRKARELVSAFKALPASLSEEMDEEKVRLATRIRFARLRAGREEAADAIWAAVKASKKTPVLASAVQTAMTDPDLSAEQVIHQAEQERAQANESRAQALSRTHAGLPKELLQAEQLADDHEDPCPVPGEATEHEQSESTNAPLEESPASHRAGDEAEADATACLESLRLLLADLRSGKALSRYARGSLRLLLDELHPHLDNAHDQEVRA